MVLTRTDQQRRLSIVCAAICLLAIGLALVIPWTRYSEWLITVLFALFAAAYVLVGGLVSARRPDNPVGWLMLSIGALLTAPLTLGTYAGYVLLERPSWPLGLTAAWVTTWIWLPAFCGIVLLILIFPRGQLVGPFRVWTARGVVIAGVVVTVAAALTPGPMDGFGAVRNPYGMDSWSDQIAMVVDVSGTAVVAAFVMALASIFVRLRRAQGDEAQQLKWFAYGAFLMMVAQVPNFLPVGLGDTWVGLFGLVVSLVSLPAAIAVAILRHRLYDIDVVIKRTLVYGSLTVLLAVTYLSLVLALRLLLDPLIGDSQLAVAASTLVVAALFRPLRSRIQRVVDRHFYRSRYDAARTVATFSEDLRHEVDLAEVEADLCLVVREAMQPSHVSLWLRDPALR
jgi:hypothetical protein